MMRSFEDFNPVAVTVYFLTVTGIAMFCMNPLLLSVSLLGAILFFLFRNGRKHGRTHFIWLLMFFFMALINPLVSHNGVTVLFVLNDSPITLEATLYGLTASGMVIAVLYWFRSFTQIMTSDKLLYLFCKLSPKLALVLSMGLRYVPLLSKQTKKVNDTQTALGLYKEDNIFDRIKGGLRVFSVMISWALENGIVTADSMTARGYGTGKRSHFSIFRFRKSDCSLLIITLILGTMTCAAIGTGALDFTFYPSVNPADITVMSYSGYISYGVLVLLPTIIGAGEKIKWKFLKSKI